MKLTSIGLAMGVPSNSVDNLFEGHVPDSVAARLKVKAKSLQEFVDGTANSSMGLLLGANTQTVQELRDALGRDGAIGLIIGMALRKHA